MGFVSHKRSDLEESEELAQGHQRPSLGTGGQDVLGQRGQVFEDMDGANRGELREFPGRSESGKGGQVMAIGCQRGHAQLALDPQVVEKLLDGNVEGEAHR